MKKTEFLPRLMTIVDTEPVAGTVNPAENEQNEVSKQFTDEVTEETKTTNNEDQSSVEPNHETSDRPNVSLSANNEQVELSSELLATVLSFLKMGVKTKMRTLISYQDAKNDLQLAFVKGNRNVYGSQIDKLWKEVSGLKTKKFSRSCVVVNAKAILEHNLTIPEDEKSKRVRLADIYGNEITLATPGIENCWAVIDGQHRLIVCMEHPEVDLDIELLTNFNSDIMELIKIFNSTDKNWSLSDYTLSNIETGKISGALMEKAAQIKSFLKCSDKVATYLLTFKKDAVRKSSSIKGIDDSGYSETKGERGLSIARAIKYKFGDMAVKVQFVEAICKAYSQLEDGNTLSLGQLMVGFIAEVSDSMKKTIEAKMKSSDFGIVNNTFIEGFTKYVESHRFDIQEHIKGVQAKIDAAVPIPDLSVKSNAEVKDGFPGVILGQRLEKSVEDVEARITKLEEKEKSSLKVVNDLKAKSMLSDKETAKLEAAETNLSDIQSSLSVEKAHLEELKAKRDLFLKAA